MEQFDKAEYERYKRFVDESQEASKECPSFFYRETAGLGIKKNLLKIAGIFSIRVPVIGRVPLDECTSARRIDEQFGNYYDNAVAYVSAYKEFYESIESQINTHKTRVEQPDLFPGMFEHVHSDDGSLDERFLGLTP